MPGQLVNLEEVGAGFHGSVFRCENVASKSIYARKYIHQQTNRGKEAIVYQRYQLNSCDSIVKLVEYLADGSCLFELMPDGDMRHWMKSGSLSAEEHIWRIAHSLIDACTFMEKRSLLHGDIKPENVLLDIKRHKIKLTDFAESHDLNTPLPSQAAGSLPYMAPERLANQRTTTKSDIWSVGVILLELCLGHYPFSAQRTGTDSLSSSFSEQDPRIDRSCLSISLIELWESIHDTQVRVPGKYSRKLAELIKCCLTLDPRRRLCASQLQCLFKL